MKIKTIAASVALVTLGSIGSAMAGQGENTLNFTLNADVTKAVDADNVQIRVYRQDGTELPSSNLNVNLQEVLDTAGNLMWGSNGKFNGSATHPQIDPANIYDIEIYSKNSSITYNGLSTEYQAISLQNGADTQNVLTGYCGRTEDSAVYYGAAHKVPDMMIAQTTFPAYYEPVNTTTYGVNPAGITQGYSMYFSLAFFATLPGLGDDLTDYTPGAYTGSGSMIIRASWL